MFTGLVEEIGTVRRILNGRDSVRIRIQAPRIGAQLRAGESVAVDGVCLTATETFEDAFEATAVSQTLKQSTLGRLRAGDRVNPNGRSRSVTGSAAIWCRVTSTASDPSSRSGRRATPG
jgi:riboflavin synthase alpha subunit